MWSNTRTEHIETLKRNDLKLNKDKCKFFHTEIIYLGHVLTNKGIRPDQSKIDKIINIPKPECNEDLQRFLGMTNYLSKFLPNYSNITQPLDQIL